MKTVVSQCLFLFIIIFYSRLDAGILEAVRRIKARSDKETVQEIMTGVGFEYIAKSQAGGRCEGYYITDLEQLLRNYEEEPLMKIFEMVVRSQPENTLLVIAHKKDATFYEFKPLDYEGIKAAEGIISPHQSQKKKLWNFFVRQADPLAN